MEHQTKIAQKRVPPRESHPLHQLLEILEKASTVLKASSIITILYKDLKKNYIEV